MSWCFGLPVYFLPVAPYLGIVVYLWGMLFCDGDLHHTNGRGLRVLRLPRGRWSYAIDSLQEASTDSGFDARLVRMQGA